MARSSTITYEDVAAVCRELASEGAKPTFKAVRIRVGGSYDVLKRLITQWLEESAAATPNTLPQPILDDLNLIYQRLVIEANNAAQTRLDEQIDLFAAERVMLTEQLQAAQIENRAAQESRDQLGHELSLARTRLEFLVPTNQKLEKQVANLDVQKKGLEAQLLQLKEQLAEQQGMIQDMGTRHTHELELAEERTRGTERALLMRHSAEIEPLKDKISRLTSDNDHLRTKCQAYEHRYHQAKSELSNLKGQIEVLVAGQAKT
jgi:chromosome segregation ATPase